MNRPYTQSNLAFGIDAGRFDKEAPMGENVLVQARQLCNELAVLPTRAQSRRLRILRYERGREALRPLIELGFVEAVAGVNGDDYVLSTLGLTAARLHADTVLGG